MRGLTPEQVIALSGQGQQGLGMAMNLLMEQQTHELAREAQPSEIALRESNVQKEKRLAKEAEQLEQKISRSAIREVNGRQVRDVIDAQGNIVQEEDLGPVEKFKYFEDVVGNIHALRTGESPPPGWKTVTQRSTDLTEGQQVKIRENIANVDYALTTGLTRDGKRMTGPQLGAYVDLYNDQVQNILGEKMPLYMVVPEEPGNIVGYGAKDAQAIKLPYDDELKRYLTPAEVEAAAKEKGYTVREFLTLLGVI